MMKMMILAPRRADLTHDEFRAYVTGVHGPLVQSVPEVAAAIRHYHYNFPVPGASDCAFGHRSAAHLDIVTAGWFDSRQAQLDNMAQPRYLEIVRPDEHRFADGARAVMHYTNEYRFKPGLPTGRETSRYKVFYFRRRRPGLSREAFQKEWSARFPDALLGSGMADTALTKYVQSHTYPEDLHPSGELDRFFDVIDELFVEDPGALANLSTDTALVRSVGLLEEELLDRTRTQALVTETVWNIP